MKERIRQRTLHLTVVLTLGILLMLLSLVEAKSVYSPWNPSGYSQLGVSGFENLVYGSSTASDVIGVMGRYPDDVLRAEQMFPVVENFYYYDEEGTGAASVFVFENGFLVGLHSRSPNNQFVDLTYFLPNNGDRFLNSPLTAGYLPYFHRFPLYGLW